MLSIVTDIFIVGRNLLLASLLCTTRYLDQRVCVILLKKNMMHIEQEYKMMQYAEAR